jgi:hypothetical protein
MTLVLFFEMDFEFSAFKIFCLLHGSQRASTSSTQMSENPKKITSLLQSNRGQKTQNSQKKVVLVYKAKNMQSKVSHMTNGRAELLRRAHVLIETGLRREEVAESRVVVSLRRVETEDIPLSLKNPFWRLWLGRPSSTWRSRCPGSVAFVEDCPGPHRNRTDWNLKLNGNGVREGPRGITMSARLLMYTTVSAGTVVDSCLAGAAALPVSSAPLWFRLRL